MASQWLVWRWFAPLLGCESTWIWVKKSPMKWPKILWMLLLKLWEIRPHSRFLKMVRFLCWNSVFLFLFPRVLWVFVLITSVFINSCRILYYLFVFLLSFFGDWDAYLRKLIVIIFWTLYFMRWMMKWCWLNIIFVSLLLNWWLTGWKCLLPFFFLDDW